MGVFVVELVDILADGTFYLLDFISIVDGLRLHDKARSVLLKEEACSKPGKNYGYDYLIGFNIHCNVKTKHDLIRI